MILHTTSLQGHRLRMCDHEVQKKVYLVVPVSHTNELCSSTLFQITSDQYDHEQTDQLLLHDWPRPQESALSAPCLGLDGCQAHTRLLLNPVCHISGKIKANLIVCCCTFQGYRGRIWIKIRQRPRLITHDETPIPLICCAEEPQTLFLRTVIHTKVIQVWALPRCSCLGFPICAISTK